LVFAHFDLLVWFVFFWDFKFKFSMVIRTMQTARNRTPAAPIEPWKYDPSISSLTDLPFEVLLNHVLPHLDTASVYHLFTTCKLFHEMIGYPSLADHRRWNLDSTLVPDSLVEKIDQGRLLLFFLRKGHAEGWIHALSLCFGTNEPSDKMKCKVCRCVVNHF
jgi:hypothetical protein